MFDHQNSFQKSAEVLKKAMEADKNKKFEEALSLCEQTTEYLLQSMKSEHITVSFSTWEYYSHTHTHAHTHARTHSNSNSNRQKRTGSNWR